MSKEKEIVVEDENLTEFSAVDFAIPMDTEPVVEEFETERPEAFRVRITMAPLSAKDEIMVSRAASKAAGDTKIPDWKERFSLAHDEFSFAAKIKQMENIYVRKNGQLYEITDPIELFNAKNADIADLCIKIKLRMNAIGAGDIPEKNFE